jgi:ribonucleoside-diphosphate reductase alpha chain
LNNEDIVDISTVNGNGKTKKSLKKLAEHLSQASLKATFKEKFNNYAEKYFEGDLRRLSYCLKDVYNWKLYCDIKKNFKKVDYTQMIEMEDNTKFEQDIACAGGACLI